MCSCEGRSPVLPPGLGSCLRRSTSRLIVLDFRLLQVAGNLWVAEQLVDMAALVEAFVREEFELRRIFEADAGRDLPLEKGGVGAQRLQHGGLILAEQRFDEDEIGRTSGGEGVCQN